jgi:hypothetical protein
MQKLEIPDGLETSVASLATILGGPPAAMTGMGFLVPSMTWHQSFLDDIMSYAYLKYSNHLDVAAHVKQFRSIWAVNHATLGLSLTEREQSMIFEFQLFLEGQDVRQYAQQDINTFMTFQELVNKFEELFQVKIDPTEVLKAYYSLH